MPNHDEFIDLLRDNTKVLQEVRDRTIRLESTLESLKESTARDKARTERLEVMIREIERDLHLLKNKESEKTELWDELQRVRDRVDALMIRVAIIGAAGGLATSLFVVAAGALFRKYLAP
jgi:choline kinase